MAPGASPSSKRRAPRPASSLRAHAAGLPLANRAPLDRLLAPRRYAAVKRFARDKGRPPSRPCPSAASARSRSPRRPTVISTRLPGSWKHRRRRMNRQSRLRRETLRDALIAEFGRLMLSASRLCAAARVNPVTVLSSDSTCALRWAEGDGRWHHLRDVARRPMSLGPDF